MFVRAVIFVALVAVCSAHLCSLFPVQRGSIQNLTKVGTTDCFLTTGPCGGRPNSSPRSLFTAGMNATFIFMKNEDHWYASNPGNFTWTFFELTSSTFYPLGSVPDTNAPSLTVYSVDLQIPRVDSPLGYVQGIYYTNNPAVNNAVFYQCADVFLS